MTVRSRTLHHLARALTMSTALGALAGCETVPSPVQTNDDATKVPPPPDKPAFPPDGPPVVCDPLPAPYCEANATSPGVLAALPVTAKWEDGKVQVTLQWGWRSAYDLGPAPTISRGRIVGITALGSGRQIALVPDHDDVTMRLVVSLDCQGSTGTVAYDVIAGAPGGEVKVAPVPP